VPTENASWGTPTGSVYFLKSVVTTSETYKKLSMLCVVAAVLSSSAIPSSLTTRPVVRRKPSGGKQVARRAFIDDSLQDILVVREIPARKLLDAVRELQALSPEGQYISYWQVPWTNFDAVKSRAGQSRR
jgi:hypothetical protein